MAPVWPLAQPRLQSQKCHSNPNYDLQLYHLPYNPSRLHNNNLPSAVNPPSNNVDPCKSHTSLCPPKHAHAQAHTNVDSLRPLAQASDDSKRQPLLDNPVYLDPYYPSSYNPHLYNLPLLLDLNLPPLDNLS